MALMQPGSADLPSRSPAFGSCHREDSKPQSQKATLRYMGRRAANHQKICGLFSTDLLHDFLFIGKLSGFQLGVESLPVLKDLESTVTEGKKFQGSQPLLQFS